MNQKVNKQPRRGSSVSSRSSNSSTNTAQRLRHMKLHLPHTALDERSEVTKITNRRRRVEDSNVMSTFHRLFYDPDSDSLEEDSSPPTSWLLVELAQKIGVKTLVPLFFLAAFMLRISQPVVPPQASTPEYLRVRAYRLLANESALLEELDNPDQPDNQFKQGNTSLEDMEFANNGTSQLEFDDAQQEFVGDEMNGTFAEGLFGDEMNETIAAQEGDDQNYLADENPQEDVDNSVVNSAATKLRFSRGASHRVSSVTQNSTRVSRLGINASNSKTRIGKGSLPRRNSIAVRGRNASTSMLGAQDNSQIEDEDGSDGATSVQSSDLDQFSDNPQEPLSKAKTTQKKIPGGKVKGASNAMGKLGAKNKSSKLQGGGVGRNSDVSLSIPSAEMSPYGDNSQEVDSEYATTDSLSQEEQIEGVSIGGNLQQDVIPKLGRLTNTQIKGVSAGVPKLNRGAVDDRDAGSMNQDGDESQESGVEMAETVSRTGQVQKQLAGGKAKQGATRSNLRSGQANPLSNEDGEDGDSLPTADAEMTEGGSVTAESLPQSRQGQKLQAGGGGVKKGTERSSIRNVQANAKVNNEEIGSDGDSLVVTDAQIMTQDGDDVQENAKMESTADYFSKSGQGQPLAAGGKGKRPAKSSTQASSQLDSGGGSGSISMPSTSLKQSGVKAKGSGTTKLMKTQKTLTGKNVRQKGSGTQQYNR